MNSAEAAAEPAADTAGNMPDGPAPADAKSPGAALAHARRARRMQVVRIASELRLTPPTVEALERDDYAHLPSAVFVAGYIRSYARLLDLDAEPLIERFRALHPDAEAPPPRVVAQARDTVDKTGGSALLLVALLLALAIGGGYFWWIGHQESTTAPNFPPAMTAPDDGVPDAQSPLMAGAPPSDEPLDLIGEPAADQALDPTSGLTVQGTTAGDIAESPGDVDPLLNAPDGGMELSDQTEATAPTAAEDNQFPTSSSPAVTTDDGLAEDEGTPNLPQPEETQIADETADAVSGTESGTGNEVKIAFSGPCWVDVRDATGEVQLFGEMGNGDSHVLGGEPPYSLVIGNASVTEITVGGQPFDVRAVAKGNVARFELDPAELINELPRPAANSD